MTFVALSLLGAASVAVWAALTNENPISAIGATLRGEPTTTDPLTASAPTPTPAPSAPTSGTTTMIRPHPGPTTSGFGPRPRPTAGASAYHRGLDIDGQSGDPIRAAASGTVSKSYYSTGYGNRVEIDHGGGLVTSYSHMLGHGLVPAGRRIAQGEQVGLMGSTGVSTGSHLHFEVIDNGTKVDPAPFIGDRGGPHDDSRTRLVRRDVPRTESLRR